MVMTRIASSPRSGAAGASSSPDRRTRSRCAMYAASEWSGFESQNSEITSDSRLTLAASRAASLRYLDRRSASMEPSEAVHQLEEEVAHIHRPRKRAQLVNERLGAFGRPGAHSERGDLVAGV